MQDTEAGVSTSTTTLLNITEDVVRVKGIHSFNALQIFFWLYFKKLMMTNFNIPFVDFEMLYSFMLVCFPVLGFTTC